MGVFDSRLDLARRLSSYQPRVTTLSDVLYGTPQKQAVPALSSRAKTAVGGDPLAELRQQATTMFADSQRRKQAQKIAEGNGGGNFLTDILGNPIVKTILKPLEVLDVPRRAIISTVKEVGDLVTGNHASFSDWLDQVEDPTFGFGKVIGKGTGNKWLDRAIGFIGDVALDPLTYATFGSGALVKAGVLEHGAAGRLALAEKVLAATGDSAKAAQVAERGAIAARKVLSAEQLAEMGFNKSGMYLFGKHLPAVRIPLTGGLSDAAESGLSRLRLAATSTKAGGVLQRGITQKFLKEEKLALLRGEVPVGEFADKLVAVNSRNAYRAAAQEGYRLAGDAMKQAYKDSGLLTMRGEVAANDLRERLHLLLEGGATPNGPAEEAALKAWRGAFDTMWNHIDERLKVLVPKENQAATGFGRVQRYFPHVVTEEGRTFLKGGSEEAKKLIEMLGMDDLGPTTFFNPRRLVKDSKFFGQVLKEEDLTVARLNEIAAAGGFKGKFFETDIMKVADGYARDFAEQTGRVGAIAHLVENGRIASQELKAEFDPKVIKQAEQALRDAMEKEASIGHSTVVASRNASQAVRDHLLSVRQTAASLAGVGMSPQEAALAMHSAAEAVATARGAFEQAAKDAVEKRGALVAALDPAHESVFMDLVYSEAQRIISQADEAKGLLAEYEAMLPRTAADVAFVQQKLADTSERITSLSKDIEVSQQRQQMLLEFNDWIGKHYDALVAGEGPKAFPKGFEEIRPKDFTLNNLRLWFGHGDAEKSLGRQAVQSGTFEQWLQVATENDPTILNLIGNRQLKKRFEKMSVAEADKLLAAGLNGGQSSASSMIGGTVRIAQVLKFFGGIDNVPFALQGALNEAMNAVSMFGQLHDWERLMATAPASLSQYERLSARYAEMAQVISDDLNHLQGLYLAKDRAETELLHAFGSTDSGAAFAVVGWQAQIDGLDQQIAHLETKKYVFRQSSEQKTLGAIAQAEVDAIEHRLTTATDPETITQLEDRWIQLNDRRTKPEVSYTAEEAQKQLEKKTAKIASRQEQAALAESARSSTTVTGSKRVPLTDEQKKLNAAIKRGGEAERQLRASMPANASGTLDDWIASSTAAGTLSKKQARWVQVRKAGREAQAAFNETASQEARWTVMGRGVADTRREAMLKMEEFNIASEVTRRFSVLTDKFGEIGLQTTDKMLDDIMRNIRTERAPLWAARSHAFTSAAKEFRGGIGSITAEMTAPEISDALTRVFAKVYSALGDDAASLLGPRSQWTTDINALLDQVGKLESAAGKYEAGSKARAAANKEVNDFYDNMLKPLYREMNIGVGGKLKKADVKRALKAAARERSANTVGQAEQKLRDIATRLDQEAQFYRKMYGLYQQADDPWFSATEALQLGIKRQETPTWKLAALESKVRILEGKVSAVGTARAETADAVAAARKEVAAASRASRKVVPQVEELDRQIAKLEQQMAAVRSHGGGLVLQQAERDREWFGFLRGMAGVDGWKLSGEDWKALGIDGLAWTDQDGNAKVQQFIDSKRAAGEKVYVKKSVPTQHSGGNRVYSSMYDTWMEVKTAGEVPYGATLYGKPALSPWRDVKGGVEGVMQASGYKKFGAFSPSEVHAERVAELSAAERELAGVAAERQMLEQKARLADVRTQSVSELGATSDARSLAERDFQQALKQQQGSQRLYQELLRAEGPDSPRVQDARVVLLHDNSALEEAQAALQSVDITSRQTVSTPVADLKQQWAVLGQKQKELEARIEDLKKWNEVRLNNERNAWSEAAAKHQTVEEYIATNHPDTFRKVDRLQPTSVTDPKSPYSGWVSDKVEVWQARTPSSKEMSPLDFVDSRRARNEFPFTQQEWESLWAGDASPQRAAQAQRKINSLQRQLQDNAAYIKRLTKEEAQLRKISVSGTLPEVVASMREAKFAKIKALRGEAESIQAEIKRLEVAVQTGSEKVRAEAMRKMNAFYDAFKKSHPYGLDDKNLRIMRWAESDGRLNTVSSHWVEGRKRLLDQQWSSTPAAAVDRRVSDLTNQMSELLAQKNALLNSGDNGANLQSLLDAAQKELADAQMPVQKAIEDIVPNLSPALRDRPNVVAAAQRDIKNATSQIPDLQAAASVERAGVVMPESTTALFEGEQQMLQGAIDGAEATKKSMETALPVAELLNKEANRRVVQQSAVVVDLGKKIDSQLTELQALEDATRQELFGQRRQAIRNAKGATQARIDARAAVIDAQHRYDQVAAVMNGATENAQRVQRLNEVATELEQLVGDPQKVLRVASSKPLSPSEQAALTKSVERGQKAADVLAKGTEGLKKSKVEELNKAVAKGKEAATALKVGNITDAEALTLNRIYEEIMKSNLFDGYEGHNPVAAVLQEALAGEAELLLAKRNTRAAEQGVYDAQYLSMSLVPQVKAGWKSLESWGLPSMESSQLLFEMMNNLSRVQNKGLAQELSQFLHKYTTFFKAYATLSPGFHIRNALSNTFMVFAAGADLSNMREGLGMYRGWLEARSLNQEAEWIAALGPKAENFKKALRATDAAGGGRSVEMFGDAGKYGTLTSNRVTKASQRLGERVEGSGRFMLAYDSVARGMDFNTSAARVKRFLFDYTDTSALDESMKNIIPFWVWTSRNLPLQMVNQWQNPRAYAIYASLMRNVSQDDSNDVVPSWLKEMGAAKTGDNWYFAPDFGFTRLQGQVAEFGDPARLASYVNPAIRLPVELLGGRKLYNNVPFGTKPEEVAGGPAQPLLQGLLGLLGQTDVNSEGMTVTSPKANYALMSLLPPLSQAERLAPATDQYSQRQLSSWLGYLGIPLREVTPQMREAEINRRKGQMSRLATAAKNLGYAP